MHEHVQGKNPDYAFAFKMSAAEQDTAEVMVERVDWEVSKDNLLIPTVVYQPVELGGVTMHKATGFNAKFIEEKGIGPGARIVVVRSGQVIPYILEVVKAARPQMPDEYRWNDSGIHAVAVADSREHHVRLNAFFFKTIGAEGVGEKTLEHMYDHGLTTIGRIARAKVADLMRIDGFQERLAANVVTSIRRAIDGATCLQLMAASNAFGRGLAEKKLALIVEGYDWERITHAQLLAIDGIGDVLARQFVDNVAVFKAFMRDAGLVCPMGKKAPEPNSDRLKDVVVVFTNFRDKALESSIKADGGRVVGTVSSAVTHLVTGQPDKVSGKAKEAAARNIPVLTVEAFRQRFAL